MKRYFFLTAYFIITLCCYSQNVITWKNEKINLIDNNDRKQGKWIFFEANHDIALVCEYKNDTLAGSRTFYANNQPLIIREKRALVKVNKKSLRPVLIEKFTYLKNNKKIKGYYDKNGNVFMDSKTDSLYINDIRNLYIKEIPPIYYFGLEDMNIYLAEASSTIKKPVSNNNTVPPVPEAAKVILVELGLNANGRVATPRIINERTEYDPQIMDAFMKMKRWQPSFKTWDTTPSGFTIAFNF